MTDMRNAISIECRHTKCAIMIPLLFLLPFSFWIDKWWVHHCIIQLQKKIVSICRAKTNIEWFTHLHVQKPNAIRLFGSNFHSQQYLTFCAGFVVSVRQRCPHGNQIAPFFHVVLFPSHLHTHAVSQTDQPTCILPHFIFVGWSSLWAIKIVCTVQ